MESRYPNLWPGLVPEKEIRALLSMSSSLSVETLTILETGGSQGVQGSRGPGVPGTKVAHVVWLGVGSVGQSSVL